MLDTSASLGFVYQVRSGWFLILLAVLLVAGVSAAAFWYYSSRGVELSELEGVDPSTTEMVGSVFELSEPIAERDGSYFFETRVLEGELAGAEISFWGDAERLNAFANELRYINEAAIFQIGRGAGQGAMGTVDGYTTGVRSIAEGAVALFQDPASLTENVEIRDQVDQFGTSIEVVQEYVQRVTSGQADFLEDVQALARSYWANEVEATSEQHGFSYVSAVIPEVHKRVERETGARLAGRTTSELLVLAAIYHALGSAAPERMPQQLLSRGAGALSNLPANFAKGAGGVLRARDLFSQANRIDRQLERGKKFSAMNGVAGLTAAAVIPRSLNKEERSFESLTDARKLASVSEKGADQRLLKILAILDQSENADDLFARLPESEPEFYYSRELTRARLQACLRLLEQWGIAGNEESLLDMQRGRSPKIQRGPYQGEEIVVVRRIPESEAPELQGVLANLSLAPARQATEFTDANRAAAEFEAIGWKSSETEATSGP